MVMVDYRYKHSICTSAIRISCYLHCEAACYTRAVQKLRRRLRTFTWTALLAVFGLALVPTLSHALSHAQGGTNALAEICTPQGMQVVGAAKAALDANAPLIETSHLEHCPYCAQGAGALGMPAAPLAALVAPMAGVERPALFLHAPRTLFAWAAAQARAPPRFS
jgi:hypothetical protein